MPSVGKVIVSYWCPGPWPWQWLDRCEKEVPAWCYMFQPYEEESFVLGATVRGCELNVFYEWTEWGLRGPGVKNWQEVGKCYETPRPSKGKCPDAFASQVFGVLTGGEEERPALSPIEQKRKTLDVTSAESGVYKYPTPTSDLPSLMGPCRVGDWPYSRMLREEEVSLTVQYNHVQVQWSVGGSPVQDGSSTKSSGADCSWPFPLLKGRKEPRVVKVKCQLDNSQPGESTLRLHNDPADGLFSVKVDLVATTESQLSRSLHASVCFDGEFCAFDSEQLEAEQECLKRVRNLLPDFAIPGRPTRLDIVSTPWEELGRPIRAEKQETVTLLLDIMKSTYGNDAQTFTWAADRLELETGLSNVISGLKFEPTATVQVGEP